MNFIARTMPIPPFSLVKSGAFLIVFLSAIPPAESTSIKAYSTYELVKSSRLIIEVEVNDVIITKSKKEFATGREVNVEHYEIDCAIKRTLYPQNYEARTILLQLEASDAFHGDPGAYRKLKKGRTYLLFLRQDNKGKYYPIQQTQGIATIEGDVINFYNGNITKELAEDFISLFIEQVSLEQKSAELAKKLMAKNDFSDPRQTVTAFQLLVALPSTINIDDYLVKGLESNSGRIVSTAMWHLGKRGSWEGVKATIALYFKLKKENGWRKYEDHYVLPSSFNDVLRTCIHSQVYDWIMTYEKKYPEEKELFKGIR